MRHALVLLMAVLMLWPVDARAQQQLNLGLGYVRGDCSVTKESSQAGCFDGARWELLLNFYEFGADGPIKGTKSELHEDEARLADDGGRTYNWFSNMNFGGGGGGSGSEIFLFFLFAIFVMAGIFWALVYLFSAKSKYGLYFSQDVQYANFGGSGDAAFERYDVQRFGAQVSFYPVAASNFQLHMGIAAATAQIHGKSATTDRKYALNGISSKAGLGYAPSIGESGPLFLAEFEGTFFTDSTLGKYVSEANKNPLPTSRMNAGVMAGWSFAF